MRSWARPTPRRGSTSSISWPPAAAPRTWRSSRRRRPSAGARSSATPGSCRSRVGSRNNVGRQLVLDVGNAVAQIELALLEPLDLQQVGAGRMLQCGDRGIKIAVLLLQARQLLLQLAFFV